MTRIRRRVLLLALIAMIVPIEGCGDAEVGSMPAIKGSNKKDALDVSVKANAKKSAKSHP